MGSRFLSEREAALYLGISPAQLAGLRKFDLAMIEKGHKPHGPPPLWQGRSCIYASESLDEWMDRQSGANAGAALRAHGDDSLGHEPPIAGAGRARSRAGAGTVVDS